MSPLLSIPRAKSKLGWTVRSGLFHVQFPNPLLNDTRVGSPSRFT